MHAMRLQLAKHESAQEDAQATASAIAHQQQLAARHVSAATRLCKDKQDLHTDRNVIQRMRLADAWVPSAALAVLLPIVMWKGQGS